MKKILIVEDTQDIREEMRDLLKMEEFNVFEAIDGLDGLTMTNQILPNLIISDISMPKLDGYQLLAELKNNPKTENIPVIFLSAKTELVDIRKGMKIGADDYLTKPLNPEDLLAAVHRKLESQAKIENKLTNFKSQIVQFLPHELYTPLNGILGLSEYLKDSENLGGEEIQTIADGIYNSSSRLNRLIENYLEYSKLLLGTDSDQTKPDPEDATIISTSDIIDLCLVRHADNRYSDLVHDIHYVNLKFNKFSFTKLIHELISNAVKFSNPGNLIYISSKIVENKYVFTIENHGRGINPEQINEISSFVQFNRNKFEQQGMGLGLEIARLITELNGGQFVVDSKPNDYFKVSVIFNC